MIMFVMFTKERGAFTKKIHVFPFEEQCSAVIPGLQVG